MKFSSSSLYAISFSLVAIGFLLPFWPLCALGILLAALSGHWMVAACMGLVLDVGWGPPHGLLQHLYVPFTLLALMGGLLYGFAARNFIDKQLPERLQW